MSSSKRASLSSNSPLDQLFRRPEEREDPAQAGREEPAQREAEPPQPQPEPASAQPATPASTAPLVEESETASEEAARDLRQTTIMIYADQADWLDEACFLARRGSGSIISKAAILRALVDMAREDEDVRVRLRERLGLGT